MLGTCTVVLGGVAGAAVEAGAGTGLKNNSLKKKNGHNYNNITCKQRNWNRWRRRGLW